MSGTSSNGTHFLIEFGSLHRTQMRKSGIKQPDLRWLPDTFCVGWGIGLWKEVESSRAPSSSSLPSEPRNFYMKLFSRMTPLGVIVIGATVAGAWVHPSARALASGRYSLPTWSVMGSSSHGVAVRPALTIDRAQRQVQTYVNQYGNRHLVIDEIVQFQRNFYAIVKDTSTGHGAFEVLVNKTSGLVFPEYGPAMMWNTEYGMMRGRTTGGMMGHQTAGGSMTISTANAAREARQWLLKHQAGTIAETPDRFPGYYTIHFRRNGVIAGTLSINEYTGQIWYHNWHGKFISIKKVNG